LQAALVVEPTTQVAAEQGDIIIQHCLFQAALVIQLQSEVVEQEVMLGMVIKDPMVQPVNLLVLVPQEVAEVVVGAEVPVLPAALAAVAPAAAEMKDTEALPMQAKVIEVGRQLTYMEAAEVVPAVKVEIDPGPAAELVDRQRIVA
jgi:hypothetical protein